jgi:hypothetical protein
MGQDMMDISLTILLLVVEVIIAVIIARPHFSGM